MTIPSLRNIEVEGQLRGVARASALVCVVGVSSAGTPLQIGLDSRVTAITSRVGYGPMPELAAQLAASGARVAYCKIPGTTVDPGAVTQSGAGPAMTVIGDGFDAYRVSVRVAKGGTLGEPGIKLEYALSEHTVNGQLAYLPPLSIGASDSLVLPNTGLEVEFADGDLVEGEVYTFTANPPTWAIADVLLALEKIKRSRLPIDSVALAGAISPSDLLQYSNGIAALKPFGKHIWGLGEVRMPNAGESDAAYAEAIDTAYSAPPNKNVALAAYAARVPSAISGIMQRRTPLYGSIADLTPETVSENAAAIDGHAANAFLTDDLGNEVEHNALYDESLTDRFLVYRTWPETDGVYLTWARLMSTPGSSFQLILHRRIVNRAEQIADRYMASQAHRPLVAKADGTITESDAKRIETGMTADLRAGLAGDVSNLLYVLDRTAVITTVPSGIEGDLYVQPFGYPDTITTRIILTATVQSA